VPASATSILVQATVRKRAFCPTEAPSKQGYALRAKLLGSDEPSYHRFDGTDGFVVIRLNLLCFPAGLLLLRFTLLFGLLQPALLGANVSANRFDVTAEGLGAGRLLTFPERGFVG